MEPDNKKLKTEASGSELMPILSDDVQEDVKITEAENKEPKIETPLSKLTPILDDELLEDVKTMDVFVGTIPDKKLISKTIQTLNIILPIPELKHLKRVRNSQVVVFPAKDESIEEIKELLEASSVNLEDLITVKVASKAPITREQYEKAHELWPCNFHENKYTESLVRGSLFSKNQLEYHLMYLQIALHIEGCVIVDPRVESIIATAKDLRHKNPSQHATIVGIGNVAKSQRGEPWIMENYSHPDDELNARKCLAMYGIPYYEAPEDDSFSDTPVEPYLCTNYYVYLMNEPCPMCAMALVHARAKRVMYVFPNHERGALGSRCKINTFVNLNHHFEAFQAE